MNWKQYSDCRRCLGVLEGLGTALRGTAEDLFNNTLIKLGDIIEEMAQPLALTGQGGEFDAERQTSRDGSSGQEDEDPPRLWTKMDGDLALASSKPIGYAYGPNWVGQALRMGDIGLFDTPEAAKAAWEEGRA